MKIQFDVSSWNASNTIFKDYSSDLATDRWCVLLLAEDTPIVVFTDPWIFADRLIFGLLVIINNWENNQQLSKNETDLYIKFIKHWVEKIHKENYDYVMISIFGFSGHDFTTKFLEELRPLTKASIVCGGMGTSSVKLVDDKGNVINLNGSDWCFTLICECLYQY